MIPDLRDDNFIMFAMKSYDSPNYMISEFEEDLKRIKYIKRLIRRYRNTGDIKERLILNHIIIMGNVFGIESTVRMLFFKHSIEDYIVLKTFLVFLNYMPKIVIGIRGTNIHSSTIGIDINIGRILSEINHN